MAGGMLCSDPCLITLNTFQIPNLHRFATSCLPKNQTTFKVIERGGYPRKDRVPSPRIFSARTFQHVSCGIGFTNGQRGYVVSRMDRCTKYPIQLHTSCLQKARDHRMKLCDMPEPACPPCLRYIT